MELPGKLSDRRHFCDYITSSRGTTTQAFEEFGFSRAMAAFISQELVLSLRDPYAESYDMCLPQFVVPALLRSVLSALVFASLTLCYTGLSTLVFTVSIVHR
ncbi:hypothetical protein JOQ06_011844 [Pogonophryne albipinna]|uniref:Uncharacterized protein n=1 Tax=Pogonophryne albipinna TaxID=1090488 RepID=A0AAD6BFJ3_9TELE|nr:hypothetical protein JOQ06_011844 [Pogonophryne albipinna]